MKIWISLKPAFNAGTLCLVPGIFLALFGGIRTVWFLRIVHTYQSITARELIQKLILPHMLLLLGIGLITAAFILFTRAAIIGGRRRHREV